MTQPVKSLTETYDELKKVKWPTQQEIIKLTGVVLVISITVGIYIGGLDYLLVQLLNLVIK